MRPAGPPRAVPRLPFGGSRLICGTPCRRDPRTRSGGQNPDRRPRSPGSIARCWRPNRPIRARRLGPPAGKSTPARAARRNDRSRRCRCFLSYRTSMGPLVPLSRKSLPRRQWPLIVSAAIEVPAGTVREAACNDRSSFMIFCASALAPAAVVQPSVQIVPKRQYIDILFIYCRLCAPSFDSALRQRGMVSGDDFQYKKGGTLWCPRGANCR